MMQAQAGWTHSSMGPGIRKQELTRRKHWSGARFQGKAGPAQSFADVDIAERGPGTEMTQRWL